MQRRDFIKAGAFAGAAFLIQPKAHAASADAHIEVLLDTPLGTISPFIYSHFTEELGAVIYDGVWVGEKSKIANTQGIRTALIDKLRQIKAPAVRWPGGCFADSYDWRDGVGPRDKRPKRTDFWVDDRDSKGTAPLGPGNFDPNQFGTDEFVRFCKLSGAEPYLAANVRSLPAYVFDQWVEYCNSPAGSSTYADVRAAGGTREPYNVKYWGVGNESWGCGGTFTPDEYASEYRRYTAWVPRYGVDLNLIASGPNQDDVEWTQGFFENVFGKRKIKAPFGWSLHYYTDLPEALAFKAGDVYPGYSLADRMEKIMNDHWTAMGVHDREHQVKLIVDEYGPWYRFSDTKVDPSHVLGQQLTVRDGVMTALTLDIFNRNPEKVAMAACAQLINCIDSLFLSHEDQFITTPVFNVFDMYKDHMGGQGVRVEFSAPAIHYPRTAIKRTLSPVGDEAVAPESEGRDAQLWGLNGSASRQGNTLTLTVVNPHLTDALDTQILLRGGATASAATAQVLGGGADVHTHNTFAEPNNVQTRTAEVKVSGSTLSFVFPPSSVVKLSVQLT
ncbi:alpha-N-arabinofuranosidase [Acidipila sp. EB88]|uniref:alpha-N-arabinofuranosidase n=1 Tax=Acidipila sp. EB88 TaxID=2305226 RepID=UPI000F5EAFB7|nr:alpha-L-arabinofuranosidase C-terminal domain-containing protein [Acidipila sp. EB88]RRA47175.1 alpha-L-arabinofuranosidase [Acidipila sp. EB88]